MNFSKEYRVKPGQDINLSKIDPSSTNGFDKEKAEPVIEKNIKRLQEQQTRLYADGKSALLIILQGMDASGKDGVIRHVMSGINPLNCTVTSFKAPSKEELEHDFLWRIHSAAPAKGTISIFNRSHYEDVLIVRVKNLVPKEVWEKRYDQINDFEKILSENGTQILKFFLYISKEEQKERLEERLNDPQKNWKFNPDDLKERERWDEYIKAYEAALNRCSTEKAPWFIVPSNKKWFRNLVISEIIDETLEKMNLQWPKPEFDPKKIKII